MPTMTSKMPLTTLTAPEITLLMLSQTVENTEMISSPKNPHRVIIISVAVVNILSIKAHASLTACVMVSHVVWD